MSVIAQLNKKLGQSSGRTLTLLSVMLSTSLALTACSSGEEHHEASAVDKVEEAAEMAKKNAPEPVKLELDNVNIDAGSDGGDTPNNTDATDTEGTNTGVGNGEGESTDGAQTEDSNTTNAQPATAADSTLSADAGKQLYEKACKACHATGLLNAPKLGDKEAWATRTAANDKATLVKHSAEGFNQMPAQAVNGVTVEQVAAAVDYMIQQSS